MNHGDHSTLRNRSSVLTPGTRFVCALFVAVFVTALPAPVAMAWTTMNIPGTWDGFSAGDTTMPFRMNKVSPPGTPGGADWFTNVMFVASSGGRSEERRVG